MSRKPAAVQADSPIGAAVALMHGAEIRHLLVMEGDRLTGVLSSRDLGRLVGDVSPGLLSAPVSRIMTEDPVTNAPEAPVTTAARVLLEMRIGSLPVRDGDEIVGILTLADALESLLWFAKGAAR
jgi:CBS domain-containing protein